MTIEQVAVELLGLSTKERALLAEKLLASLEEDAAVDVEGLWGEEAERRLRQANGGEVSLRPAAVVMADARARIKE